MQTIARLPALAAQLDAKRIAATALAIAVHAVVLMMLMLPAQIATRPAPQETTMVVTPIREIIKPPEPPQEKPRPQPPRPHVTPQTPPQPVEVAVINDTPNPVDPFVESVTLDPPQTFDPPADPQPSFAQLRADIAPIPPYPAQAVHRRLTGLVMLRVLVDENGRPAQVEVENSSGHRLLDEAAMATIRKRWHFVPATRDGQPISAWALVPVNFELGR